MVYEQILTETHGRVGVIKLNRPEKLNAWTDQMSSEIREQVEAWNAEPAIGAIMFTGEGRAFCAGADVGGFQQRADRDSQGQGEQLYTGSRTNITNLLRNSKPSVAAINGYAVGVGLTMILPCDIRIASTDVQLSIRFIKMGLMPELGSTRILSEIVGVGHAADMCLSGRMVPADEALRMGLVSEVTEPEELFDRALARADEIANNPTNAVMLIKELLRQNPLDRDLDAVMERENLRDQIARRAPNHREAVEAFLAKREPNFNQEV